MLAEGGGHGLREISWSRQERWSELLADSSGHRELPQPWAWLQGASGSAIQTCRQPHVPWQLGTPVKLSCQSPWSSVCLADEDLTAHGSLWLQCVLQLPVALVPSAGWQGTTALSVGVTVPGRALCSCPLLGHVPWVMSSASPSMVPSSCPCTYSARVSCSRALCGLPWELHALASAM